MQVEIKLDETLSEPSAVIRTPKLDEETRRTVSLLQAMSRQPFVLSGWRDGKLEVIPFETIIRIYAEDRKVLARTVKDIYQLRFRLYELEKKLDPNMFVRISNSEIINLNHAVRFDFSFSGTIGVVMTDTEKTYVSRRFVPALKAILGMGGKRK